MQPNQRVVCVQALATLPLQAEGYILVIVPRTRELQFYKEALQEVLPEKLIVTSGDLRKNFFQIHYLDVLVTSLHHSLNLLLRRQINPARIIIVGPEDSIDYQGRQRFLPLFEAFFLRLSMKAKAWRQTILISQEPLIILRSLEIGLIQSYFEHPEGNFDYEVEEDFFPLSDDELDVLLLALLSQKHFTIKKLQSILQKGAQNEGLLFYQPLSRKRITQRLLSLRTQYHKPLTKKGKNRNTHWTTTDHGRNRFRWGFDNSQIQALEQILREDNFSNNQLLRFLIVITGYTKSQEELHELMEWVKNNPLTEHVPASLTKLVKTLRYPIRYMDRFYLDRLNFQSQQLLQRLKELLLLVEHGDQQRLVSSNQQIADQLSLDRKKTKQATLKDVMELLKRVGRPVTVQFVKEELSYPRWVAKRLLDELANCDEALLKRRVVTDGTSRRAYYAMSFPEHFEQECGRCHRFARDHCSLWRIVYGSAGATIPKVYEKRGFALYPSSIACEEFQPTEVTRSILYHNFVKRQEQVCGVNSKSNPTAKFACICCYTPLPLLHEGTERCTYCGTAYRLFRDKNQNIIVIISPDYDQFLAEAIQRWTGLEGFQRKSYPSRRYFSIYPEDKVFLEGNYLVVGRGFSHVAFEVAQLAFLRLFHCDLPKDITNVLEQAGVTIYRYPDRTSEATVPPLLEAAIDFDRQIGAFNRPLVENNLISRALLWNQQFSTDHQAYHRFLTAWLRLKTEDNRDFVISYEGQAAIPLWDEIHKLARKHGFHTRSRIIERYVPGRVDRVPFGSCAYSSFHALVNGLFSAGYRACRQLLEEANLSCHGVAGLLHYRESTSLLDEFGLQLDLADILKPLFLSEFLERIKAGEITHQDVWYFHGRRCEKVYYLSYRTQQLLHDCVETVLNHPIPTSNKIMTLRDTYREFLRKFRQTLLEVYQEAVIQSYLFQDKYFTGVGLATLIENPSELMNDLENTQILLSEWTTMQQRAINYVEERLAPLILTGNVEEKELIQDILDLLGTAS